MALPYSNFEKVFTLAAATANATVPNHIAQNAASVEVQFDLAGFSGTIDFQGSIDNVNWVALPYMTLAAALLTPATAQLVYTTSTTQPTYLITLPMPFMRIVMTRSLGTITAVVRGYSEPYAQVLGNQSVAPTSSATSNGYGTPVDVTRPANTTAYSANDVVGGAIDLGVMGPNASQIILTSARLMPEIAAVPAGMTSFTLYLYGVTPPSAIADNGAWTLASADLASFKGSISLGTPVLPAASSAALIVEVTNVGKQITLTGTHLFGYLVTAGAYTPAGNSEVYNVTAKSVAV